MCKGKLHINKETRKFLKWFGVRFFPTSTVMVFLPTMRKGYTCSFKFGRVSVMEKKKNIPAIGGALPYLYTHMTSILILNLIISCLIRGFVVELIVMMNPYEQRLAFRL